ncbi:MAG: site-specific integrase [Acidobacteriia bacterium]|nr:site-specific integrase [Terriglobia bacterium]
MSTAAVTPASVSAATEVLHFSTRLVKAGADAFTIQKLAGHSSITISQRYVHADREVKESAIRLLDALNVPKGIVPSDTIKEI